MQKLSLCALVPVVMVGVACLPVLAAGCVESAGATRTLRGLGRIVDRRVAILLHSTTKCPQVKFSIVLTMGTRGTIDAAAAKRCFDPNADTRILPLTVTGGTGAFASATGSGTITVSAASAGYGFETETWKGRLTLPK